MRLITRRLTLRRFAESDLADFLEYQSLPEVRRFMPGEPMNDDEALDFLKRQARQGDQDRDAYQAFAVVLNANDRVIGDVGMYLPSNESVGDLGFQFHPDVHGQGYAFEATKALVEYAFATWKLELVTSHCSPQNLASYRLMQRLGMMRVEYAQSIRCELPRP